MTPTKDLPTLATLINAEHSAAEKAARSAIDHAITAGRLLSEAKGLCEHGTWGPWLAANFAGSSRLARSYVQLFKRRDELSAKWQTSADLSIDAALKLLAESKQQTEWASAAEFWASIPTTITVPELEPSTVYQNVGSPLSLVEIIPSAKYPGYWYVAVYHNLDTDNGAVDYGARPCIREAIPHTLDGKVDRLLGEWQPKPWNGEEPWFITAPGKPAKVQLAGR